MNNADVNIAEFRHLSNLGRRTPLGVAASVLVVRTVLLLRWQIIAIRTSYDKPNFITYI